MALSYDFVVLVDYTFDYPKKQIKKNDKVVQCTMTYGGNKNEIFSIKN